MNLNSSKSELKNFNKKPDSMSRNSLRLSIVNNIQQNKK